MTTDSLGVACGALSLRWDGVVRDFLAGRAAPPQQLESWAESYRGRGEGAVQPWALPELFLGPLTKPRAVFLALNPGDADRCFHARDGVFADEIRNEYGSYSAWAASWPYLRAPWVTRKGETRHHRSRLRFLRDWTGESELPCSAMVSFELYPWHSARFTARLRVEDALKFVHEYVLNPVKELRAPVFAFGAPWFGILENPVFGLKVVARLGVGGESYGSRVASRSVRVLQGSGGLTVIAEKHSGSAGPPSREETDLLRKAVLDVELPGVAAVATSADAVVGGRPDPRRDRRRPPPPKSRRPGRGARGP